jgi:hypothetical protein
VRLAPLAEHCPREAAERGLHAREDDGDGIVREEDAARLELREDAAERPDVDLRAVGEAEDDFGRALGARLDLGRKAVRHEARGAKVNHLHLDARLGADEDV